MISRFKGKIKVSEIINKKNLALFSGAVQHNPTEAIKYVKEYKSKVCACEQYQDGPVPGIARL